MRTRASLLTAVFVAFGLALFAARAPLAQTETTIDVRNFEVLAVDGNRLILRDKKGTQVLIVPDDFRFTVDGRKLSAKQLKPGMKGQATVTTKTTVTPVTLTEFRDAVVVSAAERSMTIRGADGVRRRFTQSELDTRGIEMIKDGRVVRIGQLVAGDQLTATLISNQPPTVVTETEVDVKLAQAKVAPAPDKPASAAPVPASDTTAQAAPPASPVASAAESPPPPSQPWLLWAVVVVAIVALVAYFLRRKKG